MLVYTAPEDRIVPEVPIKCFMAGGVQKCGWQKEFLDKMEELSPNHLILFNPRRDDFDMSDPKAERQQIEWEFKYLNKFIGGLYIFSMYFDESESPQPICFYELGRYLVLMRNDYSNCIISVNPGFSRKNDVIIQTELATEGRVPVVECFPVEHACRVYQCYKDIKWRMK